MPTVADWKAILEDEPDNELVRFTYAKALIDESRFQEAEPEFARLVRENPDYALAWAFLARCRLQIGDRDGARQACERGLPVTRAQKHEVPEAEMLAVLDELDSEF